MSKKSKKQCHRYYIRKSPVRPAPSAPKTVLGIDPGLEGAFAVFDGENLEIYKMPLIVAGKDRSIDFDGVYEILVKLLPGYGQLHVYLERAVPFAMGSKGAFNYGRGFAALEIAISLVGLPVTYVEPSKWTKEMHEGISTDLRPKVKSLTAVKRLYPKLVGLLPTAPKGAILDGPIDALLIAGYGLRKTGSVPKKVTSEEDFF